MHQASSFRSSPSDTCKGWHLCKTPHTPEELATAKKHILVSIQRDAYPEEYTALQENQPVSKSSVLLDLDPFLGDGFLRIGERLRYASFNPKVRNLGILPKQSCHEVDDDTLPYKSAAPRVPPHRGGSEGRWPVGCCRQAADRLSHLPLHHLPKAEGQAWDPKDGWPFPRMSKYIPTIHTCGPWNVVIRYTRGGMAHSKQWDIRFTCMSTRAVHIVLIESMDSATCINALRRFFEARGPAKQ